MLSYGNAFFFFLENICILFLLSLFLSQSLLVFIFVFHNYSLLHHSVMLLVEIQFEVGAVAMKYLCHRVIDMLMVVVYFDDMLGLYFG